MAKGVRAGQGDELDSFLPDQDLMGLVLTSIVDGNDLSLWMNGLDFVDHALGIFCLIVERDDDRNFHESLIGPRATFRRPQVLRQLLRAWRKRP